MKALMLNEIEQVNGGNMLSDLSTYAACGALGAIGGLSVSNAVGAVTLNQFIAPYVVEAAFFAAPIPAVGFVAVGTLAGFAVANYLLFDK